MKKDILFLMILATNVAMATTTTVQTVRTVAPVNTVTTTVPVQTVSPAPPSTVIINNSVGSRPSVSDADANIISGIYQRYSKESALTGTNLNIASDNGVVVVSGSVTQQSQADQAIAVAKAMPGVKTVISKITVITNPNASVTPEVKNY